MKKILFICTMVLFSSIGVIAQQPPQRGNREDMEKRQKERIENYIKELKLDEKKGNELKKIFSETQAKLTKEMESMRESGNMDREAMRTKMTKVNEERDAKVKKALSADQYKKYEQLMKAEQERRPGGPGAPGGNR